jgi:outer membrane protein OmpA-like peptidoglycan-associated protein
MVMMGTGCASRGYVRTQVDDSAGTLSAEIDSNTEAIERTGQDLQQVAAESRTADQEHAEQISSTQDGLQEAQAEIATVRRAAENAGQLAGTADERARQVAAMFADRGQLLVEDTREIYFAFSSAAIEDAHTQAFEEVTGMLRSNPNAILVLEGRTDSTGDTAFNQQLGERRVQAARNYLIMEMGLPVYRIHGFSYGEARPEYDNETLEERQKNRSVRLLVLSPDPPTTVASIPE